MRKGKNHQPLDERQEKRKFMQEILEMANSVENDSLVADQISLFLNQRRIVEDNKFDKIEFSQELEKIAVFFKDSQNEALEFLKNSKDHNTMLEFTQSFHRIVSEYKTSKSSFMEVVTAKIFEAMETIRNKYS